MHTEYFRRGLSERRVELLIVLVVGVFSKHILGEKVRTLNNTKVISAFTRQCNW
jgi:hypothetical protein